MKRYTFIIAIILLFVQCGGDDDGPEDPTPWNANFGRVTMKIDGKQITEEEMRKMSAFHDFINSLDMEDFDKRKS